ncbi:MAG: hypothetical protein Q9208_005292 [Pyrenodesmia sp. 3 TL-2023]
MSNDERTAVNYDPIRALHNTTSDSDFAILIPQNRSAKAAFGALILYIASHENTYSDAARFVRLNPLPAIAGGSDQLIAHAPTNANVNSAVRSGCGHFALNLDGLDQGPPSWAVGEDISSGPRRLRILLSPPTPAWQNKGISDNQFELTFEAESYRMLLTANGMVELKHGTLMTPGSHSVEHGDVIGLGDFQVGDFRCSAADFQKAPQGDIIRGWSSVSGKAVAIKEHKSMAQAVSLRDKVERIGKHENLVNVIDVVGGLDEIYPKAYCILTPPCIGTLAANRLTHIINLPAQVKLSADWASGIDWLHKKGKVHTNISPCTLSIVGYEDLKGVVTHLDDMVDEQEQNGEWDIPYRDCRFTAPEVMANLCPAPEFEMESVSSTDGFHRPSDMFGLGMSISFMVSGGKYLPAAFDSSREEEDRNHAAGIPYHWTTKPRLRRVREYLKEMKVNEEEAKRQFLNYGRCMLAWEPNDRYTATEAHVLMQALARSLGGVGRMKLKGITQTGTKRASEQIPSSNAKRPQLG